MKSKLSYIFNPFEKIAGIKALILGLCFMLITFVICKMMGVMPLGYFCSFFSLFMPGNYPWIMLISLLIPWLILSILFYVLALIFSKSKVRIIDVFGTLAFCQIAVMFEAFIFLPSSLHDIVANNADSPSILTLIFLVSYSVFCIIWFCILVFNAVKISCNLKKAKLWVIYVIVIILTYVLSLIAQLSTAAYLIESDLFEIMPVSRKNVSRLEGVWKGELIISETKKEEVYISFASSSNPMDSGLKEVRMYIPNQKRKIIFKDLKQGADGNRIIIANDVYGFLISNIKEEYFKLKFYDTAKFTNSDSDEFRKINGIFTVLKKLENICKEEVVPPSKDIKYLKINSKKNPKGILLENDLSGGFSLLPYPLNPICVDDGKIYRITQRVVARRYIEPIAKSYIFIEGFDSNLDSLSVNIMELSAEGYPVISSFKAIGKNKLGFVISDLDFKTDIVKNIFVTFDTQTGEFSKHKMPTLAKSERFVDFTIASDGGMYFVYYTFLEDNEVNKCIKSAVAIRKFDKDGNKITEFEKASSDPDKIFFNAGKLLVLENKNLVFSVSIDDWQIWDKEVKYTNIFVLDSELNLVKAYEDIKGGLVDAIKTDSGKIVFASAVPLPNLKEELYFSETVKAKSGTLTRTMNANKDEKRFNVRMTFFDSEMKEILHENNFDVKDFDYYNSKLLDLKDGLMILSRYGYNYRLIANDGTLQKTSLSPHIFAEKRDEIQEEKQSHIVTSGLIFENNFYINTSNVGGIFNVQYLLRTDIPKE